MKKDDKEQDFVISWGLSGICHYEMRVSFASKEMAEEQARDLSQAMIDKMAYAWAEPASVHGYGIPDVILRYPIKLTSPPSDEELSQYAQPDNI